MLKKEVLRKKDDFSLIYKKGKSIVDKYLIVFYKENDLGYQRHGFLASKKVGNSVKRNRARRLMKESWRLLADAARPSTDYIFVARSTILSVGMEEVKKSMERALKK